MMTKISTAYLKWALITLIFVMAGISSGFSQEKLSKKQRKKQEKEALASRLFVEGQKFLMLEEYDRAFFYFEKALSYNADEAAIYFKMAEILTRANQLDKALPLAREAVSLDPSNKYYKLMIVEIYSKQNKPAEAAEVLQSLMANGEENQQYILELASLYLASQNFDNALVALNQAEDYYGVVEQLTAQKQRIYLSKNDLEGAIKEGEKLIAAQPGNAQYVLALVEILFNNNRNTQAIKVINESLKTYPDQPELFMALFTLHKEAGAIEKANQYLVRAFAHPDLSGDIKARTFSELMREMKTEARESLLDELETYILELNADDALIQAALGDRAQLNSDKETALTHYRQSLTLNPANEEVLQATISLMFELQKDFGDIEILTQTAVDEFPKKSEFWFFDGTSKLAQKKFEESKESLEKSLEINAGKNKQLELMALGQLGDAYHSLDEKAKAFETYDKVLEINPNNEHILNNYAYFLSLEKKDLDRARKMSEKLVKRFPENATYLDTHAWVLFQLEEFDTAKEYMEKALEFEKSPNGVMYEHYGDILFKLGMVNEALSFWKKAEGLQETSKFLTQKIKNKRYYD
ncbi:MAG TPA: tetratricopeptide repeat protein [Lunatimonas sp.]|nr:tetratricopeptide repeat protein [Lunatimonas sp.]